MRWTLMRAGKDWHLPPRALEPLGFLVGRPRGSGFEVSRQLPEAPEALDTSTAAAAAATFARAWVRALERRYYESPRTRTESSIS